MTPQRLTPQHASAYRALMLQAYALDPEAFTSSVAERAALPLSWWEARLQAGPDVRESVFGIWRGEELAGVAGLALEQREKTRHKATLFGLYVTAHWRGLGLGHRLVASVLDHARAMPALKLVQLTVTEGNQAALALYARHGFVPFGTEPFAVAVGQTYVAKCHLWCALDRQALDPQHMAVKASVPA